VPEKFTFAKTKNSQLKLILSGDDCYYWQMRSDITFGRICLSVCLFVSVCNALSWLKHVAVYLLCRTPGTASEDRGQVRRSIRLSGQCQGHRSKLAWIFIWSSLGQTWRSLAATAVTASPFSCSRNDTMPACSRGRRGGANSNCWSAACRPAGCTDFKCPIHRQIV